MGLIQIVSTIARINAMEPPAHIKRAMTSVDLKLTFGPKILMAFQSALVIPVIMIKTIYHFEYWHHGRATAGSVY